MGTGGPAIQVVTVLSDAEMVVTRMDTSGNPTGGQQFSMSMKGTVTTDSRVDMEMAD